MQPYNPTTLTAPTPLLPLLNLPPLPPLLPQVTLMSNKNSGDLRRGFYYVCCEAITDSVFEVVRSSGRGSRVIIKGVKVRMINRGFIKNYVGY